MTLPDLGFQSGKPLALYKTDRRREELEESGHLQEFRETKETVGDTEPVKLAGKEKTEVS